VTALIDTAVFMYAGGGEHPLREPCRAVLRRVAGGELDATTSAEVVQEVLHRYLAIRRPEVGTAMATDVLDAFAPVLPITHAVMRRMPGLVGRYPALSARDLIHVATCLVEGIDTIISPDAGLDQVTELRRLDPREIGETG
jgi:predicted nucleic acid-binding protein